MTTSDLWEPTIKHKYPNICIPNNANNG